jgi:hypothetical protein
MVAADYTEIRGKTKKTPENYKEVAEQQYNYVVYKDSFPRFSLMMRYLAPGNRIASQGSSSDKHMMSIQELINMSIHRSPYRIGEFSVN